MKSRMIVSALVLVAAVAVGSTLFGQRAPDAAAVAELKVDNLTCGACVGRVRTAAGALDGVASVEVDVATGSSRVAFDPTRVDGGRIAAAVTAAGYPAQLVNVLDRGEIQAREQAHNELALRYVGQIGERLVSREEFAEHLARLSNGYPQGLVPAGLDAWAWQELVQRELLLGDAAAHQVDVGDEDLARELEKMRQAMPGFDALVAARFGSVAAYEQRLRADLVIARHVEQNLAKGEADARQRQQLVERRLRDVATRVPVTVFDAGLKARLSGQGGCGGCC
ncbi:cation transporter [Geoalkalibacter sp.]|uniref:cation transporter n=1 Tax=Geoalkalibacter sp. TaxID=3041440 RepID=UPI00272E74F5|nr:cation transporter [Geoalkalibacter sp.]